MSETVLVNLKAALRDAAAAQVSPNRRQPFVYAPGGPMARALPLQQGWCKTVTGIDRRHRNGFSLEGEFLDVKDEPLAYPVGLYLDCDKYVQEAPYRGAQCMYCLFRLHPTGEVILLQTIKHKREWAARLWSTIESHLPPPPESLAMFRNEGAAGPIQWTAPRLPHGSLEAPASDPSDRRRAIDLYEFPEDWT